MTKQNQISRAWDIIEKARIGMLTMQFAGGLRARPLEARTDRDAGIIWFVTDVRGAKEDEINVDQDIGLPSLIRTVVPIFPSPVALP
jgi:general stress protein 26